MGAQSSKSNELNPLSLATYISDKENECKYKQFVGHKIYKKQQVYGSDEVFDARDDCQK